MEQREKWIEALRRTWNAIGPDLSDGKVRWSDMSFIMTRDEVFEISGDAPLESHGNLTAEELKEFRNRDRRRDNTLKKEAFPYKRYGC